MSRIMKRLMLKLRVRTGGQAMTEMVMVFPIFVLVMLVILKLFALVLVVQKAEIASAYAARKWMLEAHRSSQYMGADEGLKGKIRGTVTKFIGTSTLLGVNATNVYFTRTQVWTMVEVSVNVASPNVPILCIYKKEDVCDGYGDACNKGYAFMCGELEEGYGEEKDKKIFKGAVIRATKYVPVRDRPIKWSLPSV